MPNPPKEELLKETKKARRPQDRREPDHSDEEILIEAFEAQRGEFSEEVGKKLSLI